MAFDYTRLQRSTEGNAFGVNAIFCYTKTTDTLATITASGYFNNVNSGNPILTINIGDCIWVNASNGNGFLTVSGVDPITTVYEQPIITPGSITTADLADHAVTYVKMQNVSATDLILGRSTAGSGTVEEIACTAAGRALLDDASAAAQLATLGAAASGANTDITSVYLNNTGLKVKDTNASHGLSIVPGSDLAADRVFTLTTGDAARTLDISAADVTVSAFGATLVDDANAAAARTTLGLAASSALTVSVPLTTAQFKLIYSTPFLILASGGADTVIRVHDWALELVFGLLPYLNGGATALQYGNTNHGGGILASAATIPAATIDGYLLASGIVGVAGALPSSALTDVAATGIYLSCDTAEFDTGDSAVIIHVTYSVVSTV